MLQILRRNPLAALAALLMHIAIILFLVVGVDWLEPPKQPKPVAQAVQARVVDGRQVAAEVERLRQADQLRQQRLQQEQQRLQALKRKQQAEEKRLRQVKQQRLQEEKKRKQAEQQRKAEEKKRQRLAQQRKAEEKKRKQAEAKKRAEQAKRKKAEAAKRKKAEAAKRKKAEAAKRKAEEKKRKQAEAKRKAEEKKRKQAEAKRKAEEKKRKAAEAARKAREAELQAAMEAERNASEIQHFMVLTQQKIIRNWVRLEGMGDGLKATLNVRLAPGGNVIAVNVIKSSGNGAFDRSAVAAVYKADPLPVPDGKLFEQFRQINFVFDPNR